MADLQVQPVDAALINIAAGFILSPVRENTSRETFHGLLGELLPHANRQNHLLGPLFTALDGMLMHRDERADDTGFNPFAKAEWDAREALLTIFRHRGAAALEAARGGQEALT